jgi:dopamine receptor D1
MNNSSRSSIIIEENDVLTENGEVYNPIEIGMASVIIKIVSCSIGIPLNISVAVTITRFRRLNRKPRTFFLLGIVLSYLSFFIVPMIELIYWGIYSDESLCHTYVAVTVVPQGLLLMNMLLALIDRYFAINYPLLHREIMTVRFASIVMILSSILIIFFLKFNYIVGLDILRCEILLVHVKMTLFCFIVLFVACAAMNIVIYRQTKILLRESRTVEATPSDDSSVVAITQFSSAVTSSMAIHVGRKKLCEMEMEATRTLIIGMTSLCIMPCLNVVFVATFFACRLVFRQSAACSSNFNEMWPFVEDTCLIPAIYGPIIFLVRNKELRAAWACVKLSNNTFF